MQGAAARVAERWLRSASVKHERSSPLDYRVSGVQRLALYDPSAAPDSNDTYTKDEPGLVAFIDFSYPWRGLDEVFIHYMYVRKDQRGKGHMRKLLGRLYKMFSDADGVDWGEIMSGGAEKLWRDYRKRERQPGYEGPRTHGKLW